MSPHVSPSGRSRGVRPAVEAPNRGKNKNFFSRTLDKLLKFRYSSRPALQNAAVAQLDRVSGYEPEGRGFESCQPRHFSTGRKLVSKEIGLFLLPGEFFSFSSPPSLSEVIHRFSRRFFSKFSICTFLHQFGFSLVREGICRAPKLRCLSYPQILWINRRTTCPPCLWTTLPPRSKPLLGGRVADSKRPRFGYPPRARPFRCFPPSVVQPAGLRVNFLKRTEKSRFSSGGSSERSSSVQSERSKSGKLVSPSKSRSISVSHRTSASESV